MRKPPRPLCKVSKTRAEQMKVYRARKKVFLETHEYCFVCGCWIALDIRELHHVRGRAGKLYLDERFWECACSDCHAQIHTERRWAIANGFLGGMGEWGVCP